MKRILATDAWAYEIDGERHKLLCRWAEPSRERLTVSSSPSPEARPVAVKLVLRSDWTRARNALEILDGQDHERIRKALAVLGRLERLKASIGEPEGQPSHERAVYAHVVLAILRELESEAPP